MKVERWLGVLGMWVGVALATVHLRAEQARSAARCLRSESDRLAWRADLWALQMEVARLRGPAELRQRLQRFRDFGTEPATDSPGETGRILTFSGR